MKINEWMNEIGRKKRIKLLIFKVNVKWTWTRDDAKLLGMKYVLIENVNFL